MNGDFVKLNELTSKAESECSDLDFDYLKAELEGFQSGDFSVLKEKLRSSIQESESSKFPCGYQAMRLNILLAQESGDPQEAAGYRGKGWKTTEEIKRFCSKERSLPHNKITSKEYQELTSISRQMATIDLKKLVEKGVLVKTGKAGRGIACKLTHLPND